MQWGLWSPRPLIWSGSSPHPAAPCPAPSDTPDVAAWDGTPQSGGHRGAPPHPGTSTQNVRVAFILTTVASARFYKQKSGCTSGSRYPL